MKGIPPDEHDRRRQVYLETSSDEEAAAGLGISYHTFRSWRRRAGLPVKPAIRTGPQLDAAEHQRRLDVWLRTESDGQAARVLGLLRCTFQSWRKNHGMMNKRTGCLPGEGVLSPQEERRRLDAWAASRSFREAAKKIGIAPQTYEHWAMRRGIPVPAARFTANRIGFSDYELRIWKAFCTSLNDREAATRAGIGRNAMRRWRIRNGWPDHRRTPAYWQRLRQEAARGNPIADYYVRKRFPYTHGLDNVPALSVEGEA